MKCPKCKLVEMLVNKVKGNSIELICKKCGETIIKKSN